MRKWALAALSAALVTACAQDVTTQEPTPEARLAHGQYIVQSVGMCGDCHTPMLEGGAGFDQTRALQGAPISGPHDGPFAEYAPALAGGPENYTEAQLVSFLQTGVRPDGSHPRPPMPAYRLNEEDARAVAAYIISLPRAAE